MSNNERQFRRMWQWIAKETRRRKRRVGKWEYFDAFNIPETPYCDCYACEEAIQRVLDDHNWGMMCNYCPIDWGKCDCTEEGTLFYNWKYAHSYEDIAELAEQIAQMEWRDTDERAEQDSGAGA
jgi:hypothetical protein